MHIFLISALAGGEWSASFPGRFTPGERAPGSHLIGDCVYPRASRPGGREEDKILASTGTRTPTPLSSSQSLYRLFVGFFNF
jgi:hypothetical protein